MLTETRTRETAKFNFWTFNIDFIAEYVTDNGDQYIDYDDWSVKTLIMGCGAILPCDIDDHEDRFTRMLVGRWNADGVEKKLYNSIQLQIATAIQVKKNVPPFRKSELESLQNV